MAVGCLIRNYKGGGDRGPEETAKLLLEVEYMWADNHARGGKVKKGRLKREG